MIQLNTSGQFAVVPRFEVENLDITVLDEFLKEEITLTVDSFEEESGYLIVNYQFTPVKDRQYTVEIKDNTITAWKGKAIGVPQ